MKILTTVTLLTASFVWAQNSEMGQSASQPKSVEAICKQEDKTTVSVHPIPGSPNWFFRVFPDTDGYVSVATNSTNKIINLYSGDTYSLPGSYDPVPLWDENVITTPGMNFYSVAKILNGEATALPLYTDSTLGGVYQSVGTVKSNGNSTTYRLVSDFNTVSFRDYDVKTEEEAAVNTIGKNGQTTHTCPTAGFDYHKLKSKCIKSTVTPIGVTKTLCQGRTINLPMISKDGKLLAGRDNATGTTKIFEIDPDTAACTEKIDLHVETGKADFEFDKPEVVFHMSGSANIGSSYFSSPDQSWNLNAYNVNYEEQWVAKITQGLSGNNYYPVRNAHGKVYLFKITADGVARIAIVDPSKADHKLNFTEAGFCADCKKNDYHSAVAVGSLFLVLCDTDGSAISPGAAAVLTLSLDPERCRKLVNQFWDTKKADVQAHSFATSEGFDKNKFNELTIDHLLAACPGGQTGPDPTPTPGKINEPTYENVVQTSCAHCHSAGVLKIDFTNVDALKTTKAKKGGQFGLMLSEAIKLRLAGKPYKYTGANGQQQTLNIGKMPVGLVLKPEEIKAIAKKLE